MHFLFAIFGVFSIIAFVFVKFRTPETNGILIAEAHKTAVQVSEYVCTQQGVMPELPDRIKK